MTKVVKQLTCSCGHKEAEENISLVYSPLRGQHFTFCTFCFGRIELKPRGNYAYQPLNETDLTKLLSL